MQAPVTAELLSHTRAFRPEPAGSCQRQAGPNAPRRRSGQQAEPRQQRRRRGCHRDGMSPGLVRVARQSEQDPPLTGWLWRIGMPDQRTLVQSVGVQDNCPIAAHARPRYNVQAARSWHAHESSTANEIFELGIDSMGGPK